MPVWDYVTDLDASTFSKIFESAIWLKFYFFMKILLVMIFVFGVIVIIYKYYLQYNIRLTIFKRIGRDSFEVIEDFGKTIMDETGKSKIVTMKTRKAKGVACSMPVPETQYKGKRGRFDHYLVMRDVNGELHPISSPIIVGDITRMEIRPQERDAWARLERELLLQKYDKKDMLLKYATPAILMTACITAFLIFFFASKELGQGMSNIATQMGQIATNCIKIGGGG